MSNQFSIGQRVRISESVSDFSGKGTAKGVIEHWIDADQTFNGKTRYMVRFDNGQWYYFAPEELITLDTSK